MGLKAKTKTFPTPDSLSELRVGIVSRPEHAVSHAQALEENGFVVEMLGGDVKHIPPRIDIVVVRTQSCSHNAQDVAQAWAKKTKKKYICTNSLSLILDEARHYRADRAIGICVDTVKREVGLPESDVKHLRRVMDIPGRLVTQAYQDIGFFHPALAACDVDRLIAFLTPYMQPYQSVVPFSESAVRAIHALLYTTLGGMSVDRMIYLASRMVDESRGLALPGNVPPVGDGALVVRVASEDPELRYTRSDVWRSEKKHRAIVDFLNSELEKQAAPAPVPAPEPEPEPTPPPEPVMTPAPQVQEVAPVAKPPAPVADPMQEVEAAIRLLHECMRNANVVRVCIDGDDVSLTQRCAAQGVVSLPQGVA